MSTQAITKTANANNANINTRVLAQLPGKYAQSLLQLISHWGKMTTIVFSGGSVFEFKGPFPKGEIGHGFYNLTTDSSAEHQQNFEGHLKLSNIDRVDMISKLHRQRQTYCFELFTPLNELVFKIFIGRTSDGKLIPDQVNAFLKLADILNQNNEDSLIEFMEQAA